MGGNAYLDALGECLEKLEGRAKQVVDLHYREQHGRAEIAARLEMTADGVKSLLRRTRDVLRQCVEAKVKG
jgi:RNA polymerase sigma factor (sigma-70 family)